MLKSLGSEKIQDKVCKCKVGRYVGIQCYCNRSVKALLT